MNALIGQVRCASRHNTAQFANIFSLRKNVVLIAENEDQVSEEDRALHEELAEEIVSRLLDSGEDGEQDTDNFTDFYGFLAKKAVELAKAYQPKLRDGIKVAREW